MDEAPIEPNIQVLLQYAGEAVLVRTIMSLKPEERRSHLFKQLGEQRYLSSLRAGAIANAEVTKQAFQMDPYFLKSKIVMDAAKIGFESEIARGRFDVAKKIKEVMGLPDDLVPIPPEGGVQNSTETTDSLER